MADKFYRQHIVEETFEISQKQDWHLKDILFVEVDGKEVAFRVEHITNDKIYFVAVDAVRETTMNNMNEFLDNFLSKIPQSLVDRMVEIEHKNDGEIVRKSKLTLLSYANVKQNTGEYRLDGADDIPFSGLLTEAERCKNFEGKTRLYWLDTPHNEDSIYFLLVSYDGNPSYGSYAPHAVTVVPCFALSREE